MRSHATIDARSLAFGRAISSRLRQDPSLVECAKQNIERWLASCSPGARPALIEWREIVHGPLDGVLQLLTDKSEKGTRLRQSNPFAGVLSGGERAAILREFVAYDEVSA